MRLCVVEFVLFCFSGGPVSSSWNSESTKADGKNLGDQGNKTFFIPGLYLNASQQCRLTAASRKSIHNENCGGHRASEAVLLYVMKTEDWKPERNYINWWTEDENSY